MLSIFSITTLQNSPNKQEKSLFCSILRCNFSGLWRKTRNTARQKCHRYFNCKSSDSIPDGLFVVRRFLFPMFYLGCGCGCCCGCGGCCCGCCCCCGCGGCCCGCCCCGCRCCCCRCCFPSIIWSFGLDQCSQLNFTEEERVRFDGCRVLSMEPSGIWIYHRYASGIWFTLQTGLLVFDGFTDWNHPRRVFRCFFWGIGVVSTIHLPRNIGLSRRSANHKVFDLLKSL